MGTLAAGDVVFVPFPFSDLSQSKVRPAVCLADAGRGDFVLCQVTSQPYGDPLAIRFDDQDFENGALRVSSFARPGKLFTADAGLIVDHAGRLLCQNSRHRGELNSGWPQLVTVSDVLEGSLCVIRFNCR